MNKSSISIALILGLLFVRAWPQGMKIAVVKSKDAVMYNRAQEGFNDALTRQNIIHESIEYPLEHDFFKDAAVPDLILALGSPAALDISQRVHDIPIVFSVLFKPSFNAANITGVSIDIEGSQIFSAVKKIIPRARTIGILYDAKQSGTYVAKLKKQAEEYSLDIVPQRVDSVNDVYQKIRVLGPRMDVLLMVPDATIYTAITTDDVILYCLRSGIAVIGLSPNYVKAGALFSLSCDYEAVGEQSGNIAARIARGEKPAGIPVTFPDKLELSISLIVADRLGITIPDDVIREAKNVFK